uniref:GCK domain-containing protein n=1 Tax=Polytomella parva TaxID=51329 RepID=A0A7S0UTC3_9CHLO|mmetsp:Transcript_20525/g.36848  ORF Transcript_20525/g.36848 Transcript_20525/m.36848 type:complete len:133 (+) Transcript_20525:637-1035(+)
MTSEITEDKSGIAYPETVSESPAKADETNEQEAEPSSPYGTGNASKCPICEFIEGGACKDQHQEWMACMTEAKANDKDYIDECQHLFVDFVQCAIKNSDYYEPFLNMFLTMGDSESDSKEETGDKIVPSDNA